MQQEDLIQEFDIEQLEQRVEFGLCGGGGDGPEDGGLGPGSGGGGNCGSCKMK